MDSIIVVDLQKAFPVAPERELLIDPSPGELVRDKRGYGLTAERIDQLRGAGVQKALICGLDTGACVLGVVFTLFDAGLDCEVDPALCWNSTGLHHEALTIVREQFGTS